MENKRKSDKNLIVRILTGKGIYAVLGACLVISLTISYFSVRNVVDNLENNYNLELNGGEENWLEDAENQNGMPKQDSSSPSLNSQSSQSSSDGQSDSSGKPANASTVQKVLYNLPLPGEILESFSGNELVKSKTMNDWRVHTGIDIKAELGEKVGAVANGTVSKVYEDSKYGTVVEIEHADKVTSIYKGLTSAVAVKAGDKVELHQTIGVIGEIPFEVYGSYHLHLEMKKDGAFIDPIVTIGDI